MKRIRQRLDVLPIDGSRGRAYGHANRRAQAGFRAFVAAAILICSGLLSVTLVGNIASAATSLTSWNGYAPDRNDGILNQTIVKSTVDSSVGTELTLAANANMYYTGSSWSTLGVQVAVGARTERSMSYLYDVTPMQAGDFDDIVTHLDFLQQFTLSDNSGVMVTLPAYWHWYWFYGQWTGQIWVAENGFVVFDSAAHNDSGGMYTTPTPPTAIPSNSDGKVNGYAAPFWTKLSGGTIKVGHYSSWHPYRGVVIAWLGVSDPGGTQHNFLLMIQDTEDDTIYRGTMEFWYRDALTTSQPWLIGMENYFGDLGTAVSPRPGAPSLLEFYNPNPPNNLFVITEVKTSATKWKGGGENDDKAILDIRGWGSDTPTMYPPGTGVDLYTYDPGTYLHLEFETPWYWAVGKYFAQFIPKRIGDAIGFVSDTYDLINELRPTLKGSPTILSPATTAQPKAYTDNRADEMSLVESNPRKYQVWFMSFLPRYDWTLDASPSAPVHHLEIAAEVEVYNIRTQVTKPVTLTISLTFTPQLQCNGEQGAAWEGRTSLDTFAYNFQVSCSSASGAQRMTYHLDSTRSTVDPAYKILGLNKIAQSYVDDYLLDSHGGLGVSGYFRQDDALGPDQIPQNRRVDLYVIYAKHTSVSGSIADDWLDNIVATVPLLTSTSGTGWNHANAIINLGTSWSGFRVKLGIGRPLSVTGVSMTVEWAGVTTWYPYYLTISAGSGGGNPPTSPSPGTYPAVPNDDLIVSAQPACGYDFDHWTLDGNSVLGNPITVHMSGNRGLTANFKAWAGSGDISPITVTRSGVGQSGAFVSVTNCGGASVYSGVTDSSGQVPGITGIAGGAYVVATSWTDWSECTGSPREVKWTYLGRATIEVPPNKSPTIALIFDHTSPCPT